MYNIENSVFIYFSRSVWGYVYVWGGGGGGGGVGGGGVEWTV